MDIFLDTCSLEKEYYINQESQKQDEISRHVPARLNDLVAVQEYQTTPCSSDYQINQGFKHEL